MVRSANGSVINCAWLMSVRYRDVSELVHAGFFLMQRTMLSRNECKPTISFFVFYVARKYGEIVHIYGSAIETYVYVIFMGNCNGNSRYPRENDAKPFYYCNRKSKCLKVSINRGIQCSKAVIIVFIPVQFFSTVVALGQIDSTLIYHIVNQII